MIVYVCVCVLPFEHCLVNGIPADVHVGVMGGGQDTGEAILCVCVCVCVCVMVRGME